MTRNIEEKLVFGVSYEGQGDGVPLVLIGVPAGAWEYMKDGKTQHFDLTKAGIPLKFMLYGAATHDEAKQTIEAAARQSGTPLLDERATDFSIKPKSPHPSPDKKAEDPNASS